MRRNLRLDWRALALLGALLSIIIDWPGLVYAMPTILPPVAVTAPSDTFNAIKNDKILNIYPFEHDHEQVRHNSVKDEFKGQSTENSASFSPNRPFSDLQTERTTQEHKDVSVAETEMQQIRLTTLEKQEVNDNLNSISHKQTDNILSEVKQEEVDTGVTSIYTEEDQHQLSVSSTTEVAADEDVVGDDKVVEMSSRNTHIINSTTDVTIATKNMSATNNSRCDTSNNICSSSSISSTTTESSAKIQSTLMPTTITDNDNAKEYKTEAKILNLLSTFQVSSSHHLAILSRTERSIRSSSSTMNTKNISGGGVGGRGSSMDADAADGGGIVRRSPDMSGMKTKRLNNSRNLHIKNNLDRNERSTVSHLSGPSRKIQLYIKNRFLQLMPDGAVNGTQDDQSEYTILQRSTVDVGRIKVQGVATCLYLCMDPCGAVYGSKDFTDDCVFNENMEQHNYNTYSSTYNSMGKKIYYLALNRHGEPRKLQIPPTRSLGKLATYTNAITETVPQERVEQLIAKNFGANRIKHGIRQLCDTGKPLIELIDSKNFKARPKCNPNNSNSNSNSPASSSSSSSNSSSGSNKNKNSISSSSSNSLVKSNNSSTSSSSSSGQLLNNVPAANDKSILSNSSSQSASTSRSSDSRSDANSSSSLSIQSSISNSQNNGHISNSTTTTTVTSTIATSSFSSNSSSSNSNSNSSTMKAHSHSGDRGKKPRKCRPHENEEEHNCFRKPHALKNPGKQRRCREWMQQRQREGITDIVLPPMCKKKGPKKQQGAKNKRPPGEAHIKNTLGAADGGLGPNNRRGKKLNSGNGGAGGGRQAAKQNQNTGNGNNNAGGGAGGGQKKKQKFRKQGGGGGSGGGVANKKKQQKFSSTTTSTTLSTSVQRFSNDATSTLRPGFWETSSLTPSSTLLENYDPQAESTSDRGDREQRNVRYSNSVEESVEVSAEETSAANDDADDGDGDADNVDDNEEFSYEEDTFVASSSHAPHGEADVAHNPLTGGADDFLYYDQLDVINMGLWELTALLWTLAWILQTFS